MLNGEFARRGVAPEVVAAKGVLPFFSEHVVQVAENRQYIRNRGPSNRLADLRAFLPKDISSDRGCATSIKRGNSQANSGIRGAPT